MSATLGFYFRNAWNGDSRRDQSRVLLGDQTFPAFLTVQLQGNDIEVPVCAMQYFLKARNSGYDKLVFNLLHGPDAVGLRAFHHKTAGAIFRRFADASVTTIRIAHVVTAKGTHYYGNRSIIMDGNHDLLMMTTVMVHFEENGSYELTNPICHLSYKVFEHSENMVEKTIIKYGIPAYSGEAVNMIWNGRTFFFEKPRILIDHYDHLITKPVAPKISETSVEQFNKTIFDTYVTK